MKNVREYIEMLKYMGIDVSSIRAKRQELIKQHQELEKQLNFITDVLNTIEGNRIREVVQQPEFELRPTPVSEATMQTLTSGSRGRNKGDKIRSWTLNEHNLILANLHKLGTQFNTHKELAEYLHPKMPERTVTAIELRISKTTRGKASTPKDMPHQKKHKKAKVKPASMGTKRGKGNAWTLPEQQIISSNLPQLQKYGTAEALAKALQPYLPGRSKKAIQLRIGKQLGNHGKGRKARSPSSKSKVVVIVKEKDLPKLIRWSPEEDNIVLENYELSPSKIKKLLPVKRTCKAIKERKYVLKRKGKTPIKHHTMIRKHAVLPTTTNDARQQLGSQTTKPNKEFPSFSMVAHQNEKYLAETVKDCVWRKGKIEYKDITWIRAIKNWDWSLWNDFISEFLMNAKQIADYYGIENKFAVEKVGSFKQIIYK